MISLTVFKHKNKLLGNTAANNNRVAMEFKKFQSSK